VNWHTLSLSILSSTRRSLKPSTLSTHATSPHKRLDGSRRALSELEWMSHTPQYMEVTIATRTLRKYLHEEVVKH
jgi:hypothetical protein